MPDRVRLDAALVRRGLARSRQQASALIHEGRVFLNGQLAPKPALIVSADTAITVNNEGNEWASRGAYKLLGAISAFGSQGFSVAGKRCMDAGASTGGFTDVLLQHGASHVLAVDVGTDLLDKRLRDDARVEVLDKTNVRHISLDIIDEEVDVIVGDVSFISLRLVLPALTSCVRTDGDLMLMVKPQFEVGKDRLGNQGVVRDPALRGQAVLDVVSTAHELGLRLLGVEASPLPGPAGNVEYFVWLRRVQSDDAMSTLDKKLVADLVHDAVARGPQ